MGAEAAYLSLNRGEGGQNLIGPELGERSGLIRTEELLAARRLDGARQYLHPRLRLRLFQVARRDLAALAAGHVLKDVVRIVRRFRPQVIVSVFSGTPRDGHGQHQAAGWAAQEAFQAAGDSTRFPELAREEGLAPGRRRSSTAAPGSTRRPPRSPSRAGCSTRRSGKSYHQIAMAGRSLHRSQDMGQLQRLGPSRVRLALVEDRTGRGSDGLFAGIDTTAAAEGPRPGVGGRPGRRWWRSRSRWTAAAVPADRLAHLDRAILAASGVVCDARSDDDRVVPGQRLVVTFECWNTGAVPHRGHCRPAGCRVPST